MQPIDNIRWIKVENLKANHYNPNHVLKHELELITRSLLENGWLHPIIINNDYTIIDGFHRATITKTIPQVYQLTNGKLPCIILKLTPVQQRILTIRINRAKGTQTAYKMHEVIKELHTKYNQSIKELAKQIGAEPEEIQLLLYDNIFQKEHFNEESLYSQAWKPK